jgi:6-phosphofructokinase 2
MADILTVTLNPALDVSSRTERVRPTSKLRCNQVQRHPGGGGVNVARVLHRLGSDCAALCLLGGPAGQLLATLLEEEGVHCLPVAIAGHTRESFTVFDVSGKQEYRFVLPGPEIHKEELTASMAMLAWQVPPAYVVASGSLPPGVSADFYVHLAMVCNGWGAKLIVDGSGPALRGALDHGVYMVKPSLREMREITGHDLKTLPEVADAALQWVSSGHAEVVVVSMGDKGALMASASGALFAPPLAVEVVSAVGAGDSFVAAMVWALSQGHDVQKAFCFGVAGGSAALMSSGTGLCAATDVHRLVQGVHCESAGFDRYSLSP